MKVLFVLFILLLLVGCVTDEVNNTITEEEKDELTEGIDEKLPSIVHNESVNDSINIYANEEI